MVSGTQCGSVPRGARAVITRELAYSFVPGLQPAAPALVHAATLAHAATAFRKGRRSRLPPKLESTARPARLRRRGPVVPVRGGGRRRSGPAPPCRLSRKSSGGQTHH